MKDFRSRTNKYPFVYSPLFLIILVLVLGIFVKSTYSSYAKKNAAKIEQEKILERYNELVEKKEKRTAEIEILRTEEGKKEELRKNQNIGELGESILHIVESRE
jgi:HD superfamily phosphohydrolase